VSLTPNPSSELDTLPKPPVSTTGLASENPGWSGWDVLQLVFLTVAAGFIFLPVVALTVQRLLYPNATLLQVATYPLVTVLAQGLVYLLILAFMILIVKREPGQNFWQAIRWNWPQHWSFYLLAGVTLSFALQAIARFLPMPKDLPMDRFFRTPREAWTLSLFSVSFAPLIEELFFRGFLYPVLVRRFGAAIAVLAATIGVSLIYAGRLGWTRGALLGIFVVGLGFTVRRFLDRVPARRFGLAIAVLATAAGFSLIHAPQLGRAWGPVLVIFMVGLALTITRAVTKSVAASLVMHMAYNGALSILLFVGTDGFRHLERLNQ
jgi:membrane protease YdiL (CAAX protease family)